MSRVDTPLVKELSEASQFAIVRRDDHLGALLQRAAELLSWFEDTGSVAAHSEVFKFQRERDQALAFMREALDQRDKSDGVLLMVRDTLGDIERCEASVLCSACQGMADAMVAEVNARLGLSAKSETP